MSRNFFEKRCTKPIRDESWHGGRVIAQLKSLCFIIIASLCNNLQCKKREEGNMQVEISGDIWKCRFDALPVRVFGAARAIVLWLIANFCAFLSSLDFSFGGP
eukprot:EG_transcript_20400